MPLPYPTKVVLPFDIATAQDMNERHANDVALANGTGLNDIAVKSQNIDFTTFGSGNYSTTEKDTGFTWIDGKTIYTKTVPCGTLPNNTSKLVAHGIVGSFNVISMQGIVQESSTQFFTLPLISPTSGNSIAGLGIVGNSIRVGSNATIPTLGSYVTLTYTKV